MAGAWLKTGTTLHLALFIPVKYIFYMQTSA